MSRIPRSFIDELIARASIVEVVGSRVALKKAGREYKACCPFHTEKTPSFWVSPEKQFYHCFGCGAHGTALSFLIEHDRLSFPEAVEELASSLGLTVPRAGPPGAPDPAAGGRPAGSSRDGTLHELMARVAQFYAEALGKDARAQRYLAQRGLDREIIERFAIGYAPSSWNELRRRFGSTQDERRRLAELGLIVEKSEPGPAPGASERAYDRFRDRIMFPIRDGRGRVIAFGGRVIGEGEPKYLNSPETALFHKGRELYGLHEARQSRAASSRLLVVEGYLDVVRLHQFSIPYAVATLGTSTTAEHLKRLFQIVPEVTFAFDGDRAGRAAAWRALEHSLPEAHEGREIRFLFLPEGEDPDTLVAREGREAFEARVTQALPLSEYLVRELGERVTSRGADGRARVAQLARPLLEQVPEGIYRRLLVERLAQAFGFQRTPEGVAELLGVTIEGRPAVGGARALGPGRGGLVRQAIRLLLQFPQTAAALPPECLPLEEDTSERGLAFLRTLLADLREHPATSTGQILERWRDKPEGAHLARLAAGETLVPGVAAARLELAHALEKLVEEAHRRRLDALLEKDREGLLSSQERSEIQRLTMSLARGRKLAAVS